MGFFNNLILTTAKESALAGISVGNSVANKTHFDGSLQFYTSKPYDNIFVYSAKRDAMQKAFAEINNLYPSMVKKHEREIMEQYYRANKEKQAKVKIIDEGQNVSEPANPGRIHFRGGLTDEGVLMWIKGDYENNPGKKDYTKTEMYTYWDKIRGLSEPHLDKNGEMSHPDSQTYVEVPGHSVFLDLTAIAQVQSNKNLVLTKVQGRDYSRKELISNGDLQFSVSGKIVSNYKDEYPRAAVSAFLKLMQYKGVVQVYGLLFEQLHVTQVLIKDFRMNQNAGYKNVQPYSFTCVAVEPDSQVEVIKDTLQSVDWMIRKRSKNEEWWSVLHTIKESAIKSASSTLEILTSQII